MTTTQRVDVARLSVSVERLPPIERDEQMQRDYIPIPGGWEVQTKGNGSTYRIARTDDDDGERWPVTDRYLQDALTNMAHAIRADYAALLQQLADTANKSDSRRVKLIKAQRQRRELHEYIRMMAAEISMLRNGAEQEKLNLLTRLHATERARERAIGLLRAVIAWRHTAPIAETPNRKEGGVFGRIAAFLAVNK